MQFDEDIRLAREIMWRDEGREEFYAEEAWDAQSGQGEKNGGTYPNRSCWPETMRSKLLPAHSSMESATGFS